MTIDLLERVEKLRRSGRYSDALSQLNTLAADRPARNEAHAAFWQSIVALEKARIKLHARDDSGAVQALGSIPEAVRDTNPGIDAEVLSVFGIVSRREGMRLWKAGALSRAKELSRTAIGSFNQSAQAARLASDQRLRHRADLNKLHSEGLLLAIDGSFGRDFEPLAQYAAVAEASSREYTPSALENRVSGLVVVVDLARGARMSPSDIFSLSTDPAFRNALRALEIPKHLSWSSLILHEVQRASVSPDIKGAALLVAIKCFSEFNETETTVLRSLGCELRFCQADMAAKSMEGKLRHEIDAGVASLPPEIRRYVLTPTFFR